VAAANEVIIEVKTFSLNRGEMSLLKMRPADWRPGQDIAGVVVKAAEDGSGPANDAHVVALVDQAGWSQRVAAPTSRVAELPADVSFAAAATLPVAGLTALGAVRYGGFLLGKHVLITGANGVGRFAVQLAALSGAEVTAVSSKSGQAADLRKLGASTVVSSVHEVTGHFELILEGVGGTSLGETLKLIAPEGTIVLYGASSQENPSVGLFSFGGHANARIQSHFVYGTGEPAHVSSDLALLAGLVAAGKVQAPVGREASWHDLAQGVSALSARQIAGKVIFNVD
jgi:NADPH:quinone reductase-like Zn-dependent oxidoreductase